MCLLIGRASLESDEWELAFGLLRLDWSRILFDQWELVFCSAPTAWWLGVLSGLLPLSEGGGPCE